MSRLPTSHDKEQYPHDPGCSQCRLHYSCDVCGVLLVGPLGSSKDRCTNGRCMNCHRDVCTTGGDTTPGHGYGTREAAEKAAGRRVKLIVNGKTVVDQPVKVEKRGNVTRFDFT